MHQPLRLLVIGGVAAGTKAASKARRDDPDLAIDIVTEESFVSYAGCGLAYYVGGVVTARSQLIARTPEEFRTKQHIGIHLGHRATRIDTALRTVLVTDLATGNERTMPYDRLLIATGAVPVTPPIEGADAAGVFHIKTIPDAEAIISYIEAHKVSRACIIGGGYIGAEAAENLTRRGVACTLFEREQQLLPRLFDPDMARLAEDEIRRQGAAVHTGTPVVRIESGLDGKVNAVVTDNDRYPCELVILAAGVRPAVDLAGPARIALGPTGAIRVDRRMETSIRHIYAAGDCVESVNLVSGRPGWYPLGSTANRQGRVAGTNLAGGDAVFEGVAGTAITKIFDVAAGRTGLGESEARAAGFDPAAVTITSPAIASYYPGDDEVTLKLVGDRATGRFIGAQAIGTSSVDKIIDAAASALTGGLDVGALVNLDVSYAPPCATALGALNIAAAILEDRLA